MLPLLVTLLAGPAMAQDEGFDAHGFIHAPGDGDRLDPLTTWRAERQVPWSVGLTGLFEYAHRPLVIARYDGIDVDRENALDHLVALNLGVQTAFHERVGLGLSAPLYFATFNDLGSQGAAMGDMRLWVPIGLVLPKAVGDEPNAGFGLSLVPFINLPSGRQQRFLGDGGVGGGGLLAASVGTGDLLLSAHVGAEYAPSAEFLNLRSQSRLLTALAVGYDIADLVAVRLEATFDPALSTNDVAFTNTPGEILGSLRGDIPAGLNWTLGAGTAFTRGAGAARLRVFAGLGWSHGKSAPKDTDGDGIVDPDDDCVHDPENVNGYEDEDGCPEDNGTLIFRVVDGGDTPVAGANGTVADEPLGATDGGGILGAGPYTPGSQVDALFEHPLGWYRTTAVPEITVRPGQQTIDVVMPAMPGLLRVRAKVDGQPLDAHITLRGETEELDLGDLGDDGEDTWLVEPGTWQVFAEADGYGIEHTQIVLDPNGTALVEVDLTLSKATIVATENQLITLDRVHFDFDKDTIKPISFPMLDELAVNILRFDELQVIEVQGHTDYKGTHAYNEDLSQRRVDSVRRYLIDAGVPPTKLVAVGFGERCPADTNETDEGRANNRRVQFFVLEPKPDGAIPCHDGRPGSLDGRTIEVELEKN